ncbi:MAG: DUF1343 domain-containing protein [Bacteroidales bacterium]|nr:DUF1343 domain-containing protein [Bacteroidales bacterium]
MRITLSIYLVFILQAKLFSQNILPGIYQTELYFPMLSGKKIAVVTNHSSTIKNTHLVDTLLSRGLKVNKIFCPEHGFRGQAEAGEHILSETDSKTGLPIISLYGKHYKPTPNDLKEVEVMVFDLQDVGVRCYTYLSTLHYVMEACAENKIPLIVLDRPNPNGFYIDGPMLEPRYRSFVGLHPVPLVYGMTIGEYAQMINGEGWLRKNIKCNLNVIPCLQYSHHQKIKLEIAPSPNLRTMQAIYLYPSLVLFEGTVISVGRGTPSPFTCFGHPLLDSGNFNFIPKKRIGSPAPLYADTLCIGFNLENYTFPTPENFFTIQWLLLAYNHFPEKSRFFNKFFNYLAGTDKLKKQIEEGKNEDEIRQSWREDIEKFKKIREKYLIYPE